LEKSLKIKMNFYFLLYQFLGGPWVILFLIICFISILFAFLCYDSMFLEEPRILEEFRYYPYYP